MHFFPSQRQRVYVTKHAWSNHVCIMEDTGPIQRRIYVCLRCIDGLMTEANITDDWERLVPAARLID